MQKRHIVVYSVLVWLRWIASSTPGYVHPDEYFQSPEITAGTVLGVETLTPWEYQPIHAARSIVVPYVHSCCFFSLPANVLKREQILNHGLVILVYATSRRVATKYVYPFHIECLLSSWSNQSPRQSAYSWLNACPFSLFPCSWVSAH